MLSLYPDKAIAFRNNGHIDRATNCFGIHCDPTLKRCQIYQRFSHRRQLILRQDPNRVKDRTDMLRPPILLQRTEKVGKDCPTPPSGS
jgi:hypothetical protein